MNNQIDLYEIVKVLLNKKIIIILATSFFAISSVFYALSLPAEFRSSATLQVNSDSGNQVSTSFSRFAGLAAVAGAAVPSLSDDKTSFAIEGLKSRKLLSNVLARVDFSRELFAAKDFNFIENRIIYDEELYDIQNNQWIRKATILKSKEPTIEELHNKMLQNLSISLDNETSFLKVGFSHYSPFFAQKFLTELIYEMNSIAREKDLKDSENAIAFLESELRNVSQLDVRSALSSTIERQLQKKMLSNIKEDYLITPLDLPSLPRTNFAPSRALICIFITFMGFLLTIISILIHHFSSLKRVENSK